MRIYRGCSLSMAAKSGEVLGEPMTWLKLFVGSEMMNAQGAEGREQENKSAVLADRKGLEVSKCPRSVGSATTLTT